MISSINKSDFSLLYKSNVRSNSLFCTASAADVEKLEIPAASTSPTHTGAVTAISLSFCVTLI